MCFAVSSWKWLIASEMINGWNDTLFVRSQAASQINKYLSPMWTLRNNIKRESKWIFPEKCSWKCMHKSGICYESQYCHRHKSNHCCQNKLHMSARGENTIWPRISCDILLQLFISNPSIPNQMCVVNRGENGNLLIYIYIIVYVTWTWQQCTCTEATELIVGWRGRHEPLRFESCGMLYYI